jgi:hypothetical protein
MYKSKDRATRTPLNTLGKQDRATRTPLNTLGKQDRATRTPLNTLGKQDRATRTPLNTLDKLWCSGGINKYLLHICHPSYYSCYKPSDKS